MWRGQLLDCEEAGKYFLDCEVAGEYCDQVTEPGKQPTELLDDATFLLWMAQHVALFFLAFEVGASRGLGFNDNGLKPVPGEKLNICVLYMVVSAGLYSLGQVGTRLLTTKDAGVFVGLTWFGALSFSVVQSVFKGVAITASSMAHWNVPAMVVMASLTILGIAAVILQLRSFTQPWYRVVLRCVLMTVLPLLVLSRLAPPGTKCHMHHWMIGFALTAFMTNSDGRRLSMGAYFLQPLCLGMFVQGISVFGFGGFYQNDVTDIPMCNRHV